MYIPFIIIIIIIKYIVEDREEAANALYVECTSKFSYTRLDALVSWKQKKRRQSASEAVIAKKQNSLTSSASIKGEDDGEQQNLTGWLHG